MLKTIEEKNEFGEKTIYTVDEKGIRQGPYERYTAKGELFEKGAFKDGLKEGICETYFSNGQVFDRICYVNNLKHGIYECYNKNGTLYFKCTYRNDEFDGHHVKYHPNGQVATESYFSAGIPDGPYKAYDESGRLIQEYVYRDGEVLSKWAASRYLKKWEATYKEKEQREQKLAEEQAQEKALKKVREAEWQDLKDRLKHLTDDKYYKNVPRASTPERQVELEEILMARRSKTLLLDAVKKARLAGDEDRVDAIMKLTRPFAKKHELVMHVFHDKRADRKQRSDKDR